MGEGGVEALHGSADQPHHRGHGLQRYRRSLAARSELQRLRASCVCQRDAHGDQRPAHVGRRLAHRPCQSYLRAPSREDRRHHHGNLRLSAPRLCREGRRVDAARAGGAGVEDHAERPGGARGVWREHRRDPRRCQRSRAERSRAGPPVPCGALRLRRRGGLGDRPHHGRVRSHGWHEAVPQRARQRHRGDHQHRSGGSRRPRRPRRLECARGDEMDA
mmetsp:Transcript_96314/g.278026  ORF Transcript_96314/g.278026 Transcript_96314/m.278026 type:complete len:218 (-) Transcript_96314:675-1328(-)